MVVAFAREIHDRVGRDRRLGFWFVWDGDEAGLGLGLGGWSSVFFFFFFFFWGVGWLGRIELDFYDTHPNSWRVELCRWYVTYY